ncbi:MAG: peptide-methionine (R)-S-oxide reductase MsrB [Steroidobacteraceae bacterium]|nr:peptide-methionine (R)-S-oxide reductase MsrB [Steroidobacteraceae bacterium]
MNTHSRRTFLIGAIAAPLALQAKEPAAKSATVVIENFSAAGKSLGKASVPRVVKADAEWRKQLGDDSFVVTRHEGTERPYSGKYNDNHADGIYRCICCETALFDSKTKFESGTGWPSFWKSISSANVREISDNSLLMQRTAVECARCDAHLGHVFDDGPDPTGLRYCMNSVSLNFVARPRV